MGREIGLELEGRIRQLNSDNWSARAISRHLLKQGISVSHTTVINVIKNNGKKRDSRQKGKVYKKRTPFKKLTEKNLKELETWTRTANPMTQQEMARKLGVSQQTVSHTIKHKLKKIKRTKFKVHALTSSDKQNRKINARKLYDMLSLDKLEYVVTLDEVVMYLIKKNNQTQYCYLKRGQELPDNCIVPSKESYPQTAMVVGGLTGRGRLPLVLIPKNVKVNSVNYVDYVLKPYFEKYLPVLYPNEMHKILLHHDKASSHTSKYTTQYLNKMRAKHGLNFISKEIIPVKGPDISPLDFYGFGYLKQRAKQCKATTLKGLWNFWKNSKNSKKVWDEITPEMCTKVFRSWKVRLFYVYRRDGGHIEHLKMIHRRKI